MSKYDECTAADHNVEKVVGKESGVIYWVCHTCKLTLGRACEVYSRVVGYLRPTDGWNRGKKEEFKMRKTYKVPEGMTHEEKEPAKVQGT
jgi:anaerobic ribonucleoside-triphosphate reductase